MIGTDFFSGNPYPYIQGKVCSHSKLLLIIFIIIGDFSTVTYFNLSLYVLIKGGERVKNKGTQEKIPYKSKRNQKGNQ